MAKPPGHRDHHPGWPRPAPHNHHPGPRLRAAVLIHAKGTQARDENVRITAAVRMMRPDEIPAAALSITHLPIRLNRVTAPVDDNPSASRLVIIITQGTRFPVRAHTRPQFRSRR